MMSLINTIADLEPYGLDIRVIERLDALKIVYIADLNHTTADMLLTNRQFGPKQLQNLRDALGNYREGRVVKSIRDCTFTKGLK